MRTKRVQRLAGSMAAVALSVIAIMPSPAIADDNVHIQNTYEYSEALIQADKDFKENFYTNRNHGIFGGNTRNHLLRQVSDWFIEHL